MARDDVIRTYFANFSKYKHLLSIDEQIDDHKKFATYIRKTYTNNNTKNKVYTY